MNETMLIYNRHLECLIESTRYVVISHVWNPEVADLQYRKAQTSASADDVERIICEVPTRICLGFATSLTGRFEIWHDYISVPQWLPAIKIQIILAIPRIFKKSSLTVAYLSDVDKNSVKEMRAGYSVYERCRGISNICNAKWFSRVWTAMEFTQSRELRTMLEDFTLIEDHAVHRPLMQESYHAWLDQERNQGDPIVIEQMVKMGSNLVPWQLGPLELIRGQSHRGIRTSFGIACDLLLRRCVTIRRDFFHALLNVLDTGLTEPQLSADEQEAMVQVARSCIKVGDFSPFFMIPASIRTGPTEMEIRSCGYLDLTSFAMGREAAPPTFTDVRFCSTFDNPTIQAENIGSVQRIQRVVWSQQEPLKSLSILVRFSLESTGPKVDVFINTLAGRLYGQIPGKVFDRLKEEDRMTRLQLILETLHTSNSEYPDDQISWIAEAMGLSNTSLGHPRSPLTPMRFLQRHGGTLHLADHGAVVSITCHSCHESFLLLVALLKPDSHVIGAIAYRIPGLQYEFTHEGGTGFLLKNGRIVGRFIWGTPTCACLKLEEVNVVLHDMPLPQPNTFRYGQQSDTETKWVPVNITCGIRY